MEHASDTVERHQPCNAWAQGLSVPNQQDGNRPVHQRLVRTYIDDWILDFYFYFYFQIACGVYAFRVPGAGCADVTMCVLRESNAKWFAFVQCHRFIQLYNIFCSFHSPPAHYHLGYCHAIGDAEVPPLARLRSAVVMAVVYGR